MINMSVSQLVNQVDNSSFTLYAEWEDTYFKIILLRSCTMPLQGEMHTENADYYLKQLEEPLEIYLEKTRQAFSGKNAEIQFYLEDDTLTWKQRNILTRGEITMHPLSNVLIVSDTLKQLLELYESCQTRIATLETENEGLNRTNGKLLTDMEEMIDAKNRMEKDLYGRFLLLLNTKKERIRELQKIVDGTKSPAKSVYDKSTDDESEGTCDAGAKSLKSPRKRGTNRRSTELQKTRPTSSGFKRRAISSSSNDASPEPSTSKDKRTYESLLNSPEEESEEDLFSP